MYLAGMGKIVKSRVAREDQCPPGSTPVIDSSGCVSAYTTGQCWVWNCFAPDDVIAAPAAAPAVQSSINVNVPTSVQTQVSPQISPVFVQQDHPVDSPVTGTPIQVTDNPQSAVQRPDASAYATPDQSEWQNYLRQQNDAQAQRDQAILDAMRQTTPAAQVPTYDLPPLSLPMPIPGASSPSAMLPPSPTIISLPPSVEAAVGSVIPPQYTPLIIAAIVGGALYLSSSRKRARRK